jgi:uncharacterized repeat protein (TIGR01451 family)
MLTNTVTADSTNLPTITAATTAMVQNLAELSVAIGATAATPAGQDLTYTISVTNNGPQDAQGVTLSDALPSGLTLVSQTQTSGPAFVLDSTGNSISNSTGALPAGETAVFSITALVGTGVGNNTALTNTATASGTNAPQASAAATTNVQNQADLTVALGAPSTAVAGGNLVYTLTIANNGPQDAQNVVLSDALPSALTFLSQSQTSGASFQLSNTGNTVSDSIATLAAGSSAVLPITAEVGSSLANGTTMTNTVSVSGTNASTASAAATATVQNQATLAVSVDAPAAIYPGGQMTYTLTLTNSGPQAAQNVSLTDDLPAWLTLVSQSQTSGPAFALSDQGNDITNTIASLAAGATTTFDVTVQVSGSTPNWTAIFNTASATTGNAFTSVGVATTLVQTSADVQVTESAPSAVPAGGREAYTIVVSNNGPNDAQYVTLQDTLPANVSLLSQTQTSGPDFALGTAGNGIDDTIADLAVGASATFVITGAVASAAQNNSTIVNTATVSALTADPNLANNTATANTVVYPGGVTLANPGTQNNTPGSAVGLQLQATDSTGGPGLTYAVAGLPPGLSVNSATGLISGNISTQASGEFVVTATAADGACSASQTFLWEVGGPVTLVRPPWQSSTEGSAVSLQLQAADSKGGTLLFGAEGLPPGLNINTDTGLISGTITPGAAANGPYNVTVFAEDSNGSARWGFTWLVNSLVTVTNPGNQTATEGQSVSLQVQAVDGAGASMTYSADGLPPGLNIDPSTGLISGVVDYGAAGGGPYAATVSADDGISSNSQTFTWTVNSPITVNYPGDQSAGEGQKVSLQIQASDANGGTLTFGADNLPPGLSIDPNTGPISGTIAPGAAAAGPFLTTVTAADADTSGNTAFLWQVSNPVAVAAPGDRLNGEGNAISLQIQATDTSGGALTYTAANLPPGLSINAATGLISGTIAAGAAAGGPYKTTVTAFDGTSSASTTLNWQVAAPSVTGPLSLSNPGDQSSIEGQTENLQMRASDTNSGAAIAYSANGLPPGLAINAATGVISGTISPGAAATGPYAITVIASDGTACAAQSFTWNVDSPVTVANPTDLSSTEGQSISLQVTAGDSNGGALAYRASGLPPGLSINSATGLISGTIAQGASTNGPYSVTVTAGDGTYSDSQTIQWQVSSPITLTDPGWQLGVESSSANLQIQASNANGNPLTFSAVNLPPGLSINPTTGLISGTFTIDAAAPAPYPVKVTATDGTYSASTTFNWQVAELNLGPTDPVSIPDPGMQIGLSGATANFQVQAIDNSGGSPTFSAINLPPGLTINPQTGVISGTIAAGPSSAGLYRVNVIARDGGYSAAQSFAFLVVNPVTLQEPDDQTSNEGQAVSLQLQANDLNPVALTYSASGLPPGLSINPQTGLISGTIAAGAAANGPYVAAVMASDGVNCATQLFFWGVNNPVALTDPGEQTSTEGMPASLQLQATNAGSGSLTYSATDLPPGLSINSQTGLISGTILRGAAAIGPFVPTVTVSNGIDSASIAFTWQVADAVSVTTPADQSSTEGQAVSLQIQASDPLASNLVYSATGLPAGLSINAQTGLISGTLAPGSSDTGPYFPVVTVTDGYSNATTIFTWNVANPITVTAPGWQNVGEGNAVNLQIQATDSTGGALQYSADTLPPGLSINPTTGLISGTLAADSSADSPYLTTVTATDGTYSGFVVLGWTVAPPAVDGPLTLLNPGQQSATEGTAASLQIQATDTSGVAPTFNAFGLPDGLSVNPQTGLISGTIAPGAAANSPYQVTLIADDGTYSVSTSFTWQVANAIGVTALNQQSNTEGQTVSLQVQATDGAGNALQYSATGLPAGLSIDPNTGLISGTISPGAAANGPYQTTVTVGDGSANAAASTSFTWQVACPVTLTDPGAQAITEAQPVSLQLQAADSGGSGNPLTWTATNLPPGLSLDPNTGLISGTPTIGSAAGGPYQSTITASDGTYSASLQLFWQVAAMTNPPANPIAMTSLGEQSDTEGQAVSVQVQASDSSGSALQYSAVNLPPGLSIDPNTGLISGTVSSSASTEKPYSATITARDGAFSTSQKLAWDATNPVTLDNPGTQMVYQGQTINLPVTAHYANPDATFDYFFTSDSKEPPGLSINHSTGVISGTIGTTGNWCHPVLGNYTCTVHVFVTDTSVNPTFYGSADQTFTWQVSNPVTLTNPGPQTAAEGSNFQLQLSASDSTGHSLNYDSYHLPFGLSISSSGLISGTVPVEAGLAGSYKVTVTASEQGGGLVPTASQTFTLTVLPPISLTNPGN